MRRWLLSFLALLPLSAAADDALIGIGYLNGLVGLNLEWATEKNSFYGMPAYYVDSSGLDTEEFRWVAGWRRKMERGLMSEKGFYTGLMAGDLGGERHGPACRFSYSEPSPARDRLVPRATTVRANLTGAYLSAALPRSRTAAQKRWIQHMADVAREHPQRTLAALQRQLNTIPAYSRTHFLLSL